MQRIFIKIINLLPLDDSNENRDGVTKLTYNLIPNDSGHKKIFFSSLDYMHFLQKILIWIFSISRPFATIGLKKSSIQNKLKEINFDYFDKIVLWSPQMLEAIEVIPKKYFPKILFFQVDCMSKLFKGRYLEEKKFLKKIFLFVEWQKSILYEKRLQNTINTIILVSKQDQKVWAVNSPILEKFRIVPVGIDTNKFFYRPVTPLNFSTCVFVGNLGYAPNKLACSYLIENVHRFEKYFTVDIIGSGFEVNKPINALSFLGFVDNLPQALSQYSFFLAPMFFGAGIKNKILEAMSMGLIVIGTEEAFSEIPVVNQRDCFIVSKVDFIQEAISVIERIKNDPHSFEQISLNARTIIEKNFSWHKSQILFLEAIKS